MTNRKARRATRETSIGDQRASLTQTLRLQIAGWIEHFLHARATARTFIADEHNVTSLDLTVQNCKDGRVLTFKDTRRTGEFQDGIVPACRFHDAAIFGQIAIKHSQTTVLTESMFFGTDNACFAVGIDAVKAAIL